MEERSVSQDVFEFRGSSDGSFDSQKRTGIGFGTVVLEDRFFVALFRKMDLVVYGE